MGKNKLRFVMAISAMLLNITLIAGLGNFTAFATMGELFSDTFQSYTGGLPTNWFRQPNAGTITVVPETEGSTNKVMQFAGVDAGSNNLYMNCTISKTYTANSVLAFRIKANNNLGQTNVIMRDSTGILATFLRIQSGSLKLMPADSAPVTILTGMTAQWYYIQLVLDTTNVDSRKITAYVTDEAGTQVKAQTNITNLSAAFNYTNAGFGYRIYSTVAGDNLSVFVDDVDLYVPNVLTATSTPANNSTSVSVVTNKATIGFGNYMEYNTLTTDNIVVEKTNSSGNQIMSEYTIQKSAKAYEIHFTSRLEYETQYKVTVKPEVKDVSGQSLGENDVSFTFTTGSNDLPVVNITSPVGGYRTTPNSDIAITADATDTDGTVQKVEFFANNALLSTDITSPYTYTWGAVPKGDYRITAKAYDDRGGVSESSIVRVSVTNDVQVVNFNDASVITAATPFTVSTDHLMTSSYAAKWANITTYNPMFSGTNIVHDLSSGSYLNLWVYSDVANNAQFVMSLGSENAATTGGDYYSKIVTINWAGWKLITLPFSSFTANRTPLGWNSIDNISFTCSGFGVTPDPTTVLYFNSIFVSTEPTQPDVVESAFVIGNSSYYDKQNVSLSTQKIEVTFNNQLDPSTFTTERIQMTEGPSNIPVTFAGSYDPLTLKYTITPQSELNPLTQYNLIFKTGIADLNGTAIASDRIVTFTTANVPFEIKSLSFLGSGGDAIQALNQAGTSVTCRAVIRNESGVGKQMALILALYNGTTLVDATFNTQNILNGELNRTVDAQLNLPVGGTSGYSLRAFTWDAVDTMVPLGASAELN